MRKRWHRDLQDCNVDRLWLWPSLNLHIDEWHWKIFRVDLVTLKIVTNWTSPSPQTEYFSTFLFDFKSTTFDLVDATPSIIFFVLMNSDNTLPGSIFVSTNGKASLKNHVWQHDTEAYWSCAGLDKDGWFKVENVLQV